MSLRVSFELDDTDLRHFRLIMKNARQLASRLGGEKIIARARELLAEIDTRRTPRFMRERLERLDLMIRMLEDIDWRLPSREAQRVLQALAYFCDPDDLIPDQIPGLGFLDDAIMIELVVRELRHELEAYEDFCEFRRRMAPRTRVKPRSTDVSRDDWLSERRQALQERMRRRRQRDENRPAGGGLKLL